MGAAQHDADPDHRTRRRRPVRKICLWIIASIGALALVACVWLRDIDPPDDRHALPNWTLPLDPQNPLAQFQDWLDANPISLVYDVNDVVVMPEDFPALAARVESLLATSPTSWKWREGERLADPAFSMTSPIQHLRAVAVLLAARAKARAAAGQLGEASQDALAILRLGRALSEAEGNCILWMVSTMVAAVGTESLLEVALQPAASLEQLTAWQAALETNELAAEAWAFALRVEYESFKNQVSTPDFQNKFQFKLNATLKTYLDLMPPMATDPKIPWRSTRQVCDRNEARMQSVEMNSVFAFLRGNLVGEQLIDMTSAFSSSLSRKFYQDVARHRIAVCQFALRRFELARGRLPPSMDELVPDFLAAVPLDSFSTSPLRWNAKTKIIYSVGPDEIDGTGDLNSRNTYGGNDCGEHYRWAE